MSKLYEQLMELAVQLEVDAEEISPSEDRPDDPDDPQVREAETLEATAERIKEILNASEEADTESSASSNYYVESGIRLPKGYQL